VSPALVSLVQARMSSSRLPGKVLLPLGDGTVLDQVLRRAAAFSGQVAVCTSGEPDDDAIEAHCQKVGALCLRGSRDDVFARFRAALRDPRVQESGFFARITADCPLLSVPLARRLVEEAAAHPELDYLCFRLERLPRGLPVELVRRAAFLALDPAALDGPQREHVTLALYEQPARHRCRCLDPPDALRHPELRLTLDYPEDYTLMRLLFEDPDVTAESAVARMLRDPALPWLNARCAQRPAR